MTPEESATTSDQIAEIYERESRRVFATLVRLIKDFDLAEEALQEAFATALQRWRHDGIPDNPRAWLVSAGRFRAIDVLRRRQRFGDLQPEVSRRIDELQRHNQSRMDCDIEDDRLRLIFTCCHPAIDPLIQVPLTLRSVCGFSTEEIARAFLTATPTMAQRLVRGQVKIRDAGIPFQIPAVEDLPGRLEAVLIVVYLVFNEGYSASTGDAAVRSDLSSEAIRLGRLLAELLPHAEIRGLLALMLLQESRRHARTSETGDLILLEDQDRTQWDQAMIQEGQALLHQAIQTRAFGKYTLQAAVAAVHADAADPAETDWEQIVALYDVLLRITPSPIVELNRAVAVAMLNGPQAGLSIIDDILQHPQLQSYHLAHAARADLCRRLGRRTEAVAAYQQALSLARQEPERRFLKRRLHELSTDATHDASGG